MSFGDCLPVMPLQAWSIRSTMNYLVCMVAIVLAGRTLAVADAPVTAVAMSPDGKHVVLGSQIGIELRGLPDLAVVESLSTKLEHVHDLKFSPDGQWLLAAGGSPAESGRVEVWSWAKRERVHEVGDHNDVVYRVAWSPDGTHWAASSGDGTCSVFSTSTRDRTARYEGHSRGVLACFFLDNHAIVSAGIDQTIRLWDSVNGSHQRTLDNHVGAINDISLRPALESQPNDVMASISEDRTVRLWQPRIGRLMRFGRLVAVPRCLAWSSDGMKIYVGCNDGRVRVIDSERMEIESEFDGRVGRIHEIVVNAVEEYVLTAGESGCKVISLRGN